MFLTLDLLRGTLEPHSTVFLHFLQRPRVSSPVPALKCGTSDPASPIYSGLRVVGADFKLVGSGQYIWGWNKYKQMLERQATPGSFESRASGSALLLPSEPHPSTHGSCLKGEQAPKGRTQQKGEGGWEKEAVLPGSSCCPAVAVVTMVCGMRCSLARRPEKQAALILMMHSLKPRQSMYHQNFLEEQHLFSVPDQRRSWRQVLTVIHNLS